MINDYNSARVSAKKRRKLHAYIYIYIYIYIDRERERERKRERRGVSKYFYEFWKRIPHSKIRDKSIWMFMAHLCVSIDICYSQAAWDGYEGLYEACIMWLFIINVWSINQLFKVVPQIKIQIIEVERTWRPWN